jgi:hypothetical protein
MMKTTHVMTIFGAAALMMTVGCEVPGKVTGGGFMDGAAGGRANLGFNADQCDDTVAATGHVNFHDKSVGVKANGSVLDAGFCSPVEFSSNEECSFCFDGEYEVFFAYDSKNPANPGGGEGLACLRDDGEGGGDLDNAFVYLYSGVYAGYFNGDTGWQGNIQGHDCG